jgi:hypothetical protein
MWYRKLGLPSCDGDANKGQKVGCRRRKVTLFDRRPGSPISQQIMKFKKGFEMTKNKEFPLKFSLIDNSLQ